MSMNATFVQIDEAELSRIQDSPSRAAGANTLLELLQRRVPASANTATAPPAALHLDRAWHGVHYLLCGEAARGAALLSQPVLGGTQIGGQLEDFSGYGPPRYFTAAQVSELAEALAPVTVELTAATRFDAAQMFHLDIYPGWRPSDEWWLMDAVRRLRDFYADAAANRRAIVTCLE